MGSNVHWSFLVSFGLVLGTLTDACVLLESLNSHKPSTPFGRGSFKTAKSLLQSYTENKPSVNIILNEFKKSTFIVNSLSMQDIFHTPPMEGHWKFQGGGGSQQVKFSKQSVKPNWNF